MLVIDVIGAKHGDCLIISYGDEDAPRRILVDGGPPGVYRRHLRPRLMEIMSEIGDQRPVEFELAMVSHVDQDHIKGLLELTNEMIREEGSSRDPARIKRFWHNSFSDITGGTEPATLTATVDAIVASSNAGGRPPFSGLDGSDGRAAHILAGIDQGRQLRDNLVELGLDGNRPFDGKMVLQGKVLILEGMNLEIIGPDVNRLTKLQQEWNPSLSPTQIAAFADKSIANLSSIVVLAECEGKKILLTGDARGDDIMDWLKNTGHLEDGGTFHVDVLKMPHHGSDNNIAPSFFKAVTADVYLYCGDGKHDNPEPATLRMMREAREGNNYKVVFSNFIEMEHEAKQDGFLAEIAALKASEISVSARDHDEHALVLKLV